MNISVNSRIISPSYQQKNNQIKKTNTESSNRTSTNFKNTSPAFAGIFGPTKSPEERKNELIKGIREIGNGPEDERPLDSQGYVNTARLNFINKFDDKQKLEVLNNLEAARKQNPNHITLNDMSNSFLVELTEDLVTGHLGDNKVRDSILKQLTQEVEKRTQ